MGPSGRNPIFTLSPVEIFGDTAVYLGLQASGNPRSHITLVNGKPDGMLQIFHPNGSVEQKLPWRNGKREGEHKYLFPNGKVSSIRLYLNDTLQAEGRADFDSAGNRTSQWIPGEGPGTGTYLVTSNGKIIDSAYFRNGVQVGYSFTLNSKGDTTDRDFYKDGKQDTTVLKWAPKPGTYRSTESILKVIRKQTPRLRHTYNDYLRNVSFKGKVTLTFGIAPDGRISYLFPIGDTSGKPRFVQAVMKVVHRWKFEPVDSRAMDVVTVPFTFSK